MYTKNRPFGLSLPLVFIFVIGCSAEDVAPTTEEKYNGPKDDAANEEDAAALDLTGFIPNPGGGSATHTDWEEPDESVDLGTECARFSSAAKQIETQVEKEIPHEVRIAEPISIFIMLDQSGSMWIPDIFLSFKWMVASDAISKFVNDPNSAGISAALGYFPIAGAPCDGTQYEVPAVPMGLLPDNAAAISGSLGMMFSFGGGTPTEPALIGATNYCANYKQDPVANPDGQDCVVIFITDGMPSECNVDAAYLAGIASDAKNNNGVTTFAIGMSGADFVMLNQLAEAGQGEHDCHPNDPNLYACNVSLPDMSLIQALELIRSYIVEERIEIIFETVYETEVLDCEWEVPAPPPNEELDKNKVNVDVEYSTTVQAADDTPFLPRADDATACGDNVAWYYSDEETRIIACPQTCAMIQAGQIVSINIVLGCEVRRVG